MYYNGEIGRMWLIHKLPISFFALGSDEMKESTFQHGLIEKIRKTFPGCIVLKNDPTYIQGIPDLLILHNDKWAALEVKRSKDESHRPNQDYYVSKMNDMSYSSFIYPENEKEILNELQQTFESGGTTRVSRSE